MSKGSLTLKRWVVTYVRPTEMTPFSTVQKEWWLRHRQYP
jgi:hypothetical protein